MSIRGKINLLVFVMGLAALIIGGTAFVAMNEYGNRVQEFSLASERAFRGEQLNRLVTAVVMDSRGVYGAKSPEDAKKFADGILSSLDKMDKVIAEWRPIIGAEQKASFDSLVAGAQQFRVFRMETARLGVEVGPAAANEQGNNDANRANRKAYQAEIDKVVETDIAALMAQEQAITAFRHFIFLVVLGITVVGIGIGIGMGFYIGTYHLSVPLRHATDAINQVANGNFGVDIPATGRKDEIADIMKALQVFKENGLAVQRMNAQEAALRARSDDLQASMSQVVSAAAAGDFSPRIDKDYGDENLNRFARNINTLLASVDTGVGETRRVIASLAEGDLTQSMRGDFQGAFAELQANVNTTFASLCQTMRSVRETSSTINDNTSELRHASDDLSKRTEQQAAALEETSAALDQITAVVKNSTERAQEATSMVGDAKQSAAQSASVVRNAIDAMGRIEQASLEISQIINVIDEIAFQTNLLALNAGVEAARAGEAGKGFAVVAQEVRELAQRSATAAKDIKTLITKSGTEVQSGVKLVQATGEALSQIEAQVNGINDRIHAIAVSAREQSTGLQEVNTAINQMDQVTQQNAAMVEETSASTHKLSAEAEGLVGLVVRFKVDGGSSRQPALANREQHRAVTSPARRMAGTVARAFGGGQSAAAAQSWEEF
ncbi:methyl-accepting chemotaxis protein [Rhizobium sp. LjRoot30]|uniref:methyl-accepting chemotaxis protein n=1 Tax=Rhizobium sp. LjRoot30 TaxID=3342320 RepID=UPI003ECE54CE